MKRVTTIQLTIDIVHDDDVIPGEIVRLAEIEAEAAITWTDDPVLDRAIDGVPVPVTVTSAVVIATREMAS